MMAGKGALAPGDLVAITPADAVQPGMKAGSGPFAIKNGDIRRQGSVQPLHDLHRREIGLRLQMGGIHQGVNTGIGAAAALHIRLGAENFPGGIEYGTLNRDGIVLFLPAAVTAAIKFQDQLKAFGMDIHGLTPCEELSSFFKRPLFVMNSLKVIIKGWLIPLYQTVT
jgi:hypothetical protein